MKTNTSLFVAFLIVSSCAIASQQPFPGQDLKTQQENKVKAAQENLLAPKKSPTESAVTEESCRYVLGMSKLPVNPANSATSITTHAFTSLHEFFSKHKVKDYADAASFGRKNPAFTNPDAFNKTMAELFKVNSVDTCPENLRSYQALIFNTSGIDVFIERLAFLARLVKERKMQTTEVVALVGNHAHRQDLQNPEYLLKLPGLFASDFDLTQFDKKQAQENINPLLAQKNWTHKDGMEVAWRLLACDPVMAQLKNKVRYFSGNSNAPLRTEELIEHLIAGGLSKPLSAQNPIAFVVNAQGAAKTKEMINKLFANKTDAVDLLVARPAADEVEERLFNDTPGQRAMVKLFHFYRILETVTKAQ